MESNQTMKKRRTSHSKTERVISAVEMKDFRYLLPPKSSLRTLSYQAPISSLLRQQ